MSTNPSMPGMKTNIPYVDIVNSSEETAASIKNSSGKAKIYRIHFKGAPGKNDYVSSDPLYRIASTSKTLFEAPPPPTPWYRSLKEWFLEKFDRVVCLKVNVPDVGLRYIKVNAASLKVRLGLDEAEFNQKKDNPELLAELVSAKLAELNTQCHDKQVDLLRKELALQYKKSGAVFNLDRYFEYEDFVGADLAASRNLFSNLDFVKRVLWVFDDDAPKKLALINNILRYTRSEEVVTFLKAGGVNLDTPDQLNRSPLYVAVLKEDFELASLLKKHGADPQRIAVNAKGKQTLKSPRQLAFEKLEELKRQAVNLKELPLKSNPAQLTTTEKAIQKRQKGWWFWKPAKPKAEKVIFHTPEAQRKFKKFTSGPPKIAHLDIAKSGKMTDEFLSTTNEPAYVSQTLQAKLEMAEKMLKALE